MDNSVHIQGLSKSYREGEVRALQNIHLDIAPGELFGLIGPDGAGKTTLFRLLTTLILPDEGTATVAGYDIMDDLWDIRRHVGYMPGRFSLYQDLSVEENLQFFATVFNTTVAENYHLIKDIYEHLEPFKKRPAGKLSGGMKQKLALCCALVHEPKVLLLDEPTTGVDAVSRKEFWDMLRRLRNRGITILVSTPYMDEASRCDRIALIQEGQLLEVDTQQAIIEKHTHPLWSVRGQGMYHLLLDIRAYPNTASCFAFGDTHHLTLRRPQEGTAGLEQYLREKGHTDFMLQPIQPNIEDTFIRLMQEADQE
jgi:ABC-type multidrug transport system ATPase subunit